MLASLDLLLSERSTLFERRQEGAGEVGPASDVCKLGEEFAMSSTECIATILKVLDLRLQTLLVTRDVGEATTGDLTGATAGAAGVGADVDVTVGLGATTAALGASFCS